LESQAGWYNACSSPGYNTGFGADKNQSQSVFARPNNKDHICCKAATSANLIVKDADGKEVAKKKIELASKAIDWSGKGTDGKVLKAGVYSFSVESFKDGKSIGENVVEAYSEITEVNFADKKTLLTLAGGQTVLLDKIKGLRANS
jgi:flagellar basal-body rod modification protein FlgD